MVLQFSSNGNKIKNDQFINLYYESNYLNNLYSLKAKSNEKDKTIGSFGWDANTVVLN